MGSDNFSSTVDLLKGFNVNLYVGEEIIKGKLMGVETDHIIIEDENKYVYYYSIDKIQAITKNTKQYKGEEITTEFMQTQSLADLLSSLKNSWVSILCLNKQSFDGVLSIVDTDFVTLINGENRILIKISHISNILKGYRKEEKQEENNNETESAVSDSKIEDTKEEYEENQVFAKSNKQESIPEQPVAVNIIENDAVVSPKVSVNQPETEQRVWAEPIKTSMPIARINDDFKMGKDDKKQHANIESIPQQVRQNSQMESKWSKTEMPKEDLKNKKSEVVIQNIVKQDKQNSQKPTGATMDKRAQVKQPVRETKKSEAAPKEVKASQELMNKVKQVKETVETNPLIKVEKNNRNQVESKKENKKPRAQEVGASRFSGEPAMRDFDRRSIFSGWPNRNQSQKRI
ncbi:hypothetical protein [Neobacillus niacini]|uniref:hypothetical protein n=1 Tax=Neobacillus niacini TaxID=86668 RepID=UPI0039833349